MSGLYGPPSAPLAVTPLPPGSILFANASGALSSSIGVTAATNPAPLTIQAINSTLTPAIDQFHQIGNGTWSKALLRIVDTDFNRAHGNALDISWGTTGFQINDASTTSGVTITSEGTGYHVGDAVTFSSGTSGQGSGAAGTVATVNGSGGVTGVTITAPGGGYKTNDYPTGVAVTVSGASGGSGFVGTGNLNTIGRAGIQLAGFTLPDVTGGGNTGSIAISEMGCGPAIAAYKSTGFRSAYWGNSVFANYAYDIGGALEIGALDGAHTALINSGHDFGPGADSCLLGVAIATTSAIATITVGNELFPANGTSAQPGIGRFGVPGSAAYPGAPFNKHTTLYAQITEGSNKETFSYTGVSGNTLTGVARGLNGQTSHTFTTAAEIRPIYFMGTALFRVDNDINAGVGIQPNNNAFDDRVAFYIGVEGKSGVPPANIHAQTTFSGKTFNARQHTLGAGQNLAAGFSLTGEMNGSHFASTSTITAGWGAGYFVGIGGSIGSPMHFAGMIGVAIRGDGNTTGDLSFATRHAVGDDTLTERLRIAGNGVVAITAKAHLIAGTDNTYDLGAAGATRFRTGYFGTDLIVAGKTLNFYDFGGGFVGKPATAATDNPIPIPRALNIPANMAGAQAIAKTGATVSAAFTIAKVSGGVTTTIGTLTFGAGGQGAPQTGTFTTPSGAAQSLAAGDYVIVTAPTQDATLADIGYVVTGTFY